MNTSLVIIQSLYGGGAEKQIRLYISLSIIKKPYVIFLGNPDQESQEFLFQRDIPFSSIRISSILYALPSLFIKIKKINPSIVFSGVLNINFGLAILNYLDLSNRKYIIRESGLLTQYKYGKFDFIIKLIYRIVYSNLSCIIVQSEHHKKDCLKLFHSENIKVIANLLDYDIDETKQSTNLELTTKLNFIWVGRFSIEKQPLLAIKIAEKLQERNALVQLKMFGNGPLLESCKNYVLSNKLEENITFMGHVQDPFKNANSQEILLVTSEHDTYPNIIIEADTVPLITLITEGYGSYKEIIELSPNVKIINKDYWIATNEILEFVNKPIRIKYPSNLLHRHKYSKDNIELINIFSCVES